jgi:hypothetical protein
MDLTSGTTDLDAMPPSYGSQEYWNERFTSEIEPFEWLEAPDVLDPFVLDALSNDKDPHSKVLHIGCGTSKLSYHLRTLVDTPEQIHNLDYSPVAVELGRKREQELCSMTENSANGATSMFWDAVDLLSHKSLLGACKPGTYSVIVDKSTSDSIACSDDPPISLPYAIDIPSSSFDNPIDPSMHTASDPIHPLHVLAVHLALVTKPGARWVALSYSDDRFPFVDGLYSSRPHVAGFPDTGSFWKLLDKREVESKEQQVVDVSSTGTVTYRPKVSHWVYIMQRTELPLVVRGAHL